MSYEIPFLERGNILIKRSFDLVLSFILIFLTSPIQIFYYLFNKIERKKIWGLDGKGINLNFISSNSAVISSIPLLYHVFIGHMSFVGSRFIDIKNPNPQHILNQD